MERLLIPGHKFVGTCSCNMNCWICQIKNAFANVSIIHAKTCFIKPVTNWRLKGSLFVMLVFRSDDYDAPQNWPCILKMKKFLSICVNAKTALWRQDRQNSAATSNLAAIHKRKIFEHWNESKVQERNVIVKGQSTFIFPGIRTFSAWRQPNNRVILVQACCWPVLRQSFAIKWPFELASSIITVTLIKYR